MQVADSTDVADDSDAFSSSQQSGCYSLLVTKHEASHVFTYVGPNAIVITDGHIIGKDS